MDSRTGTRCASYLCLNLYLTLLIVASTAQSWVVDFNNPIVHTQYGTIRGKIDERKTKFNRRPICTFMSIPYARPPIGANRFLVSSSWPEQKATQKSCSTNKTRARPGTSRAGRLAESGGGGQASDVPPSRAEVSPVHLAHRADCGVRGLSISERVCSRGRK